MESEIFDNEAKIEFVESQVKTTEKIQSNNSKCRVCKFGDLRPDGKLTSMIVYGRDGPRVVAHQYMRCNYRVGTGERKVECRAGHSLGFATYKGMRIYEDDCLRNKTLVVTNQTAFDIDYLIEVVGQVDISSGKFDAIAKQYNRFHLRKLPYDVLDRRIEMQPDVLSHAYFLICYLEICQRYGIKNYQIIRNNLESAILEHKAELIKVYRRRWTVDHECETLGCRSCVVIDAGLKPHRKVCKALWNGVRYFEAAGESVVTGCTSYPIPNKAYCSLHDGEPTPVADNVSSRTRKLLKKYRDSNKEYENAGDDNAYIIETILDIQETENGGKLFKVKWFDFPEEAATIEPEENVPKFIVEYYKDRSKLGKSLPNPRIKHTKKTSSGTLFHFLTWEGEKGGQWYNENFFKLAGGNDQDDLLLLPSLSCKTRKSRDKRICR